MKNWNHLIFSLIVTMGILFIFPEASSANEPDDDMLIYYLLTEDDDCGDHTAIYLGDFLKKTLAGEISTLTSYEAIKANAIAARSFTLSPQNADIYPNPNDGQNYICTFAYRQEGFDNSNPLISLINNLWC